MTDIATERHIAWISNRPVPAALQAVAQEAWSLHVCPQADAGSELPAAVAVAVVDGEELDAGLLARLEKAGVVSLVLGGEVTALPPTVIRASADVSPAELAGILHATAALQPALRLARVQAREASRSADHLDEEMRLASRLQQDFLPRRLPTVGPIRFAVLYRPASWVSGDIYDVTRLDETHVGFYVADAVGHGMPAALLTMFIKEAMQTKRISGNSYELVPPDEALFALNADLCRQNLSMCEFCTALYGIIDTTTGEFTMSRAGHPSPVHVTADGERHALKLSGPLLGVMDDATFQADTFCIAPGERLILYSDGLEDALCGKGGLDHGPMLDFFASREALSRQDLLMGLSQRLDELECEDDVTLLLVEHE